MNVIVVGAGIVGSACAAELVRRGACVTVLDAAFCGGGATAAGMGHLVVMDDSPAQFDLTQLSVELWRKMAPELDGAEYDPCGTIWVASDEEEMSSAEAKVNAYRASGVNASLLGAKELQELEPGLCSDLVGGMLVPGDAVLYPTNAARFLMAEAVDHGAEFRPNTPVTAIRPGIAEMSDGRQIKADLVINATGGQAAELIPGLPVLPRKGHLAITDRYPGRVNHQVLELGYLKSAHSSEGPSVAFNVQPRRTGQLLIGSSREFVGWNDSVNRPLVQSMLERAVGLMPGLGDCNVIRIWTGFRPATPDKLPLIGEFAPGVWLATGHEGLGIATSLATARILAEQIFGENCSIDPAPYQPSRFDRSIMNPE